MANKIEQSKNRRRIALKAARTRKLRQAEARYYREVTEPGFRRLESLLTMLLRGRKVRLRYLGRDRLKNGATYGKLVGFRCGYYFVVLIEGYKHPRTFHPSKWEVLGYGEQD